MVAKPLDRRMWISEMARSANLLLQGGIDSSQHEVGETSREKKTKKIGMEIKACLPDDIIPNILCRLPAINVSLFRLVCKNWRDLTLARDFVDLHFQHNSLPVILVSIRSKKKSHCFLLDNWWELTARKKLLIHKYHFDSGSDTIQYSHPNPLLSHAGLVVIVKQALRRFIVCNPMYPTKHVIITLSNEIRWSEIYGVFFHPLKKEYCCLWMIQESDMPLLYASHPKWIEYKILSLGSNPSMTTIGNPFSNRVKRRDLSPLFIDNKYLYWMLEPENGYIFSGRFDIMQFDIISEEFKLVPCPIPPDNTEVYYNRNNSTSLLNADDTLSFLLISPRKITIWRLKDHARQTWTTTNYTFSTQLYQSYGAPRPTSIVDGKLALLSNKGSLIVCNLMLGTFYDCKTQFSDVNTFLSHQMSLVSLTNCTFQMFIDKKGEVAWKVSG